MSTTIQLANRLKNEGEKVGRFFESLTENQWMMEVYTEESNWTVKNILSHLVTAERGFLRLFEDIREGGDGVPEGFSIDRYNAERQLKTKGFSSRELLGEYRIVREEMYRWVTSLTEQDLKKEGRHPFLGWVSLIEMIKMIYLHNQIHLRDIKRVLK